MPGLYWAPAGAAALNQGRVANNRSSESHACVSAWDQGGCQMWNRIGPNGDCVKAV